MHIEHIVPKKAEPLLSHIWSNLTYACPKCNAEKGEYCNPQLTLVNPYIDIIDEHLWFLGPMVLPQHDSPRGELTVSRLKLNLRPGLLADKAERISAVLDSLRRWASETRSEVKTFLEEGIKEDAARGTYTAAVRSVLSQCEFPFESTEAEIGVSRTAGEMR